MAPSQRRLAQTMCNYLIYSILYLSAIIYDAMYRYDCLLAMYGKSSLPNTEMSLYYTCFNLFGLCQQLDQDASDGNKELHRKFQHFRETIHGVLFVKFAKGNFLLSKLYIDRELEYYLIGNNNLSNREKLVFIADILSSFLKKWE